MSIWHPLCILMESNTAAEPLAMNTYGYSLICELQTSHKGLWSGSFNQGRHGQLMSGSSHLVCPCTVHHHK